LVRGEGVFSLTRHALRRATFPVGEGFLRRGKKPLEVVNFFLLSLKKADSVL